MPIEPGQTLPDLPLTLVRTGEPALPTRADDVFGGRKVLLFGVPGAFTPVCSREHLPGYVHLLDEFARRGVEVACLAVNDPFVLEAWAAAEQVPPALAMLSDGNAEFTRALGLAFDGSAYGLGVRSQRFALYAEDGVVRRIAVEAPGELRVSRAEAMLQALDASADPACCGAETGDKPSY